MLAIHLALSGSQRKDSVDAPSTMVPLFLRLSFLVLATSLLTYKFNTIVPEPYLVSILCSPLGA